MELKFDKIEHTLVVTIKGDIDHHTAEIIKSRITKEYRLRQCRNIILDLKDVAFMDSSGIGMIIGRYKETEILGGELLATGVTESLGKIFQLSGLYKIIRCCQSIDEALMAVNMDLGGLA